jgi:hypothetical protein
MAKAIITTSWDDGHPLDRKLADLLARYGIPATFYFPVERAKRGCMGPDDMREIGRSFDVGGHTCHHVDLRRVTAGEARREISDGKSRIEDILGRALTSFCYPYGGYNAAVVGMVREAGFAGARTMWSLTRSVDDPFRMGSMVCAADWGPVSYVRHSLAARDAGLFLFLARSGLFFRGWDRIANETLDFVLANGGIWHLWGHSWEIDANGDWRRLEAVLSRVGALSGEATLLDNSRLLFSRSGNH